MAVEATLTTRRPAPPEADFAFTIDFERGVGPASRVFLATHEFIQACQRFDHELVDAIDTSIETVMVLEDIQASSLKTWFRNVLTATNDEALKDMNWRKQVGPYLVKAKYALIQWMDNDATPRDLPALGHEIQRIAQETDVRHLPDYRTPSAQALLTAVRDFQEVKALLGPGDRASIESPTEPKLEMNLTVKIDVADIESLAVKETIQFPPATMILAVKKPDYLGDSKWELRHGRKSITAKIEDEPWLRRFQSRGVDVRPGDALKCEVKIEHLYGHDNELISERYSVTRVVDVLADTFRQEMLDLDRS